MAESDSTAGASPPVPEKQGSFLNTRQIILLVLLLIMLLALGWDYKIARPQSKAKADELSEAAQARAVKARTGQLSSDEVAEVLEREPSTTLDGDKYTIEVFKWRGGLPWKSYNVWVVYRKTSDGPRFHTLSYLTEPEDKYMPGYVPPPKPAIGDDEPPPEEGGAAPTPGPPDADNGGRGRGGEGRGGRGGEGQGGEGRSAAEGLGSPNPLPQDAPPSSDDADSDQGTEQADPPPQDAPPASG